VFESQNALSVVLVAEMGRSMVRPYKEKARI
jgi:hypothetical protein